MSILLDKIIPLFVYPVGFAVVCSLICLLFLAWGWKRTALGWMAAGMVYLWLAATPVVAAALVSSLESQYPVEPIERLPKADAIVVLGGTMNPPASANPYADAGDSVDRVFHAARLYRAGLAPRIIVSGGQLFPDPDTASEAEYMKQLLQQLGVDEAAIVIEGGSRNTRENAVMTARVLEGLGDQSVLLVTSASHMPRAAAAFRRTGVRLTPVSIDTMSSSVNSGIPFGYLPSVEALLTSTLCIKEWIGLAVYRLRGWL